MRRLRSLIPLTTALVLSCVYMALGVTHEAPVGQVEGVLTMKESGAPLPHALVYLAPQPYSDDIPERTVETDAHGHFRLKAVATGTYTVTSSSTAHTLKVETVQVDEGKKLDLHLSLDPVAPFIDLQASQHVFTTADTPGIHMHGFVPESSININLTRLDADRIADAGGLNAAFQPLNSKTRQLAPEQFGKRQQTIEAPLKKDVEGVFYKRLPLPKLPEGLYWVECTAGELHSGSYINITHLGLIAKYSGSKLLTYAVDITSGQPLSGVPVFTGSSHGLKQVGTTDAQGLAETSIAPDQKSVIIARQGDSIAVCERGSESMREHEGPNTVFLYTDRSIYRPGDTVQFKGIVRRLDGQKYSLPHAEPVEASFLDERGTKMATIKIPMGPHGTFHGHFSTSVEAAPGQFRIEAGTESGSGSVDVPVAAYRKPNYTITVLPDRPYYVLGERARATVACQYYYGGPVIGAKVKVSIFRSEDWGAEFDSDEAEDPGPGGMQNEFVGGSYEQSLEAITDANGRATFEFPTRADDDPTEVANDFQYTISASVADVGDKFFQGQGEVKVTRGNLRLRVETDRYVAAPGDVANLTVTLKPEPSARESIAGRNVEIVTGTQDWNGKRSTFKVLQTLQVVTDAQGKGTVPITLGDVGDLSIRASVVDSGGRKVRSNGSIYVSGNQEIGNSVESGSETYSLTATLDRKKYGVGDQAKLLLQTEKPGGTALLTVQAESVISRQLVQLSSKATLVAVPVGVEMTPNAYVSVAYIRDKHFMEASRDLVVTRVDRDLKVVVTPDRPNAKPGESVTFDVATFDASGHPISTDASLSVVDEAIFAIRRDTTDVRSGFYPHRNNEVMTSYSFPELYLDGGDKGSSKLPVRSRFLDTAWWEPNVQTGSDGHAKVKVQLPDNLTRWRATALACSDDALVGMSANDITARKDLMVTIQSPTYLISGDEQQVAVTVTNDTGHDQVVNLHLGANGIALDGQVPGPLHVAPGKPETVRIGLVASATGDATVTAEARLNSGGGDAVLMHVHVLPHGVPSVATRSGDTTTTTKFTFDRKSAVDPRSGGLELTLSPSLAAGLLKPMGSLIDYPYGCVEQTMSRFVPSVLVTHAFQVASLPQPKLSNRLPAIVTDSFARLSRLQHEDGGWGWWEYDDSSPFMTALVLDGLKRAEEVGTPTPQSIGVKQALDWSERWLKIDPDKRSDDRDTYYLAYVLARYGRADSAREALAQINPHNKRTPSEIAFEGLTKAALGQPAENELSELRQLARYDTDGARWTNEERYEWGEESTGLVLLAFTTLKPSDPLIPSIVRGLMARQRGDTWYSTRDTACVLTGISKFLAQSHEADAPQTVDVVVNGRVTRTVHLDPRKLDQTDATISLPTASLPVGPVSIELKRHETTGRLYYGATFTQVETAAKFAPTTSEDGFSVSRRFFVLEPRPIEDGSLRLLPSAQPVERAPTGSIVQCEITVNSNRPRDFIEIECPTPSNCHITDREDPGDGETWSWWYSGTVIRDDRIAFFAQSLPKGVSVIKFLMRAEAPGAGSALPVTAVNMYDPAERATSSDNPLGVVR